MPSLESGGRVREKFMSFPLCSVKFPLEHPDRAPVKVILCLIAVNLIKINFAVAIGSSGGFFKCQPLTLRTMISAISPVSN